MKQFEVRLRMNCYEGKGKLIIAKFEKMLKGFI